MFALQAGAIRNALVQAGMPMSVAQKLSAILSNTAAEYRTGRITQDTTPANLDYVDSDARKHQLTGIDPLADDPETVARKSPESEERDKAEQPVGIVAPISVFTQGPGIPAAGIKDGAFINVAQQGNASKISLRVAGNGKHATLDPRANVVVGKNYRFAVGNEDLDKIRCDIQENGNEVVWNTQLVNLRPMVVVTIEGDNKGTPVYGTRRIYAWVDDTFGVNGNGGPPGGSDGGGQTLNVVTSVQWTGTALVGTFANITVNSINGAGGGGIVAAEECQ